MKKNLGWSAVIAVCALSVLGSIRVASAQAGPDATTEAVWKVQKIVFVYRSDTTYYNCDALQDKLRQILLQIGARRDVIVQPQACIDAAGLVSFHVILHSPVPATEENVRQLTTYDARAELTARVRGEPLFSAEDLPRFSAEWRTVSFTRERELKLGPGDCDLVQQLRRQVLPKLAINVVYEVQCSMMSRNLGPPRLTVSALVALPSADSR